MLDIKLLSKEALIKLHEDYTRNYVVQYYGVDSISKKVENTLEWFKENGYESPDEKRLTNEDFKELGGGDDKKAEEIKTMYATHYEDLVALRGQVAKLKEAVEDCEEILPLLKDLIDNL